MNGDMTAFIQPKSDQINADDLVGGPMTITITGVTLKPGDEQPVNISIEGTQKLWRPCKSMSRVLVQAWGVDSKAYTGRSVTIYRDSKVKWGGMEVGGIRISHLSHIGQDMRVMLTESKAKRAPHTIRVLSGVQAAPPPDTDTPDHQEARAAAALGIDSFRDWFRENPGKRLAANQIIGELKEIAASVVPPVIEDDAPPM